MYPAVDIEPDKFNRHSIPPLVNSEPEPSCGRDILVCRRVILMRNSLNFQKSHRTSFPDVLKNGLVQILFDQKCFVFWVYHKTCKCLPFSGAALGAFGSRVKQRLRKQRPKNRLAWHSTAHDPDALLGSASTTNIRFYHTTLAHISVISFYWTVTGMAIVCLWYTYLKSKHKNIKIYLLKSYVKARPSMTILVMPLPWDRKG